MGRTAGVKNGSNLIVEEKPTVITEDEFDALLYNLTTIQKDVICIKDFELAFGLPYQHCAKLVREIKAVSDILHISGRVHRADYIVYLSRKFEVLRSEI